MSSKRSKHIDHFRNNRQVTVNCRYLKSTNLFKRKKSIIVFNTVYEHCPRLLTFKIDIEVYSDMYFYGSTPN